MASPGTITEFFSCGHHRVHIAVELLDQQFDAFASFYPESFLDQDRIFANYQRLRFHARKALEQSSSSYHLYTYGPCSLPRCISTDPRHWAERNRRDPFDQLDALRASSIQRQASDLFRLGHHVFFRGRDIRWDLLDRAPGTASLLDGLDRVRQVFTADMAPEQFGAAVHALFPGIRHAMDWVGRVQMLVDVGAPREWWEASFEEAEMTLNRETSRLRVLEEVLQDLENVETDLLAGRMGDSDCEFQSYRGDEWDTDEPESDYLDSQVSESDGLYSQVSENDEWNSGVGGLPLRIPSPVIPVYADVITESPLSMSPMLQEGFRAAIEEACDNANVPPSRDVIYGITRSRRVPSANSSLGVFESAEFALQGSQDHGSFARAGLAAECARILRGLPP